jgi:hypothetical protein
MPGANSKRTIVTTGDQAHPSSFQPQQTEQTGLTGSLTCEEAQHSEHFTLIVTPCTICIGAGVLQNPLFCPGVVAVPHR